MCRGLNRFFQKEKCYDRRIAVKYDITEEEKESGRLLEARERTLKEDHWVWIPSVRGWWLNVLFHRVMEWSSISVRDCEFFRQWQHEAWAYTPWPSKKWNLKPWKSAAVVKALHLPLLFTTWHHRLCSTHVTRGTLLYNVDFALRAESKVVNKTPVCFDKMGWLTVALSAAAQAKSS